MFKLYLYKQFVIVLLVLTIVMDLTGAYTTNLRGISPVEVSLYTPRSGKSWVCLDNSKTINYELVNDDYCDCADGSDEPGTAACANGHFNCPNIGHRSENIHSSRVNDGVCDCCDGSDEWDEIVVSCPNTCLERERVEKEHKRLQAELQQLGGAKRSELITKGKQIRLEREARRKALVQERNEHEAVKAEKEELKHNAEMAEAEALEFYKAQQQYVDQSTAAQSNSNEDAQALLHEAAAAFVKYDKNEDAFIDITELMVDLPLDRDRNGIVTVEEAKYFISDDGDRIDLNTFCTLTWPRIKSLKTLYEDVFKPPFLDGEEHAQQEIIEQPANTQEGDHLAVQEGVNDEVELYEEEENDPNAVEATVTPREIEYDPETTRLIDLANEARNVYTEAVQKVRQIEDEIKNIYDQTSKDYGPNEEFATLDGQCFEFEGREYVYELCPFIRVLQKPKSGGLETILGLWDQWIGGDGDRKYEKQKYAHGAACWNGPKRSCIVNFICGLEQRITSVTEPSRCEYNYVFETPAACYGNAAFDKQQHDEL